MTLSWQRGHNAIVRLCMKFLQQLAISAQILRVLITRWEDYEYPIKNYSAWSETRVMGRSGWPGPGTYESHFRNNSRLRLIFWPTESSGPHACVVEAFSVFTENILDLFRPRVWTLNNNIIATLIMLINCSILRYNTRVLCLWSHLFINTPFLIIMQLKCNYPRCIKNFVIL